MTGSDDTAFPINPTFLGAKKTFKNQFSMVMVIRNPKEAN